MKKFAAIYSSVFLVGAITGSLYQKIVFDDVLIEKDKRILELIFENNHLKLKYRLELNSLEAIKKFNCSIREVIENYEIDKD